MKALLISTLLLAGYSQAFGTHIQVDVIAKDANDLKYFKTIEILDSHRNQIIKKESSARELKIDFPNSIKGVIRITSIRCFPLKLKSKINFEQIPL